jgi:hypothetical protein
MRGVRVRGRELIAFQQRFQCFSWHHLSLDKSRARENGQASTAPAQQEEFTGIRSVGGHGGGWGGGMGQAILRVLEFSY